MVVFGAQARKAGAQLCKVELQVGCFGRWWRLAVCCQLLDAGRAPGHATTRSAAHHSLQASNAAYERDADRLLTIATSFECREVQA